MSGDHPARPLPEITTDQEWAEKFRAFDAACRPKQLGDRTGFPWGVVVAAILILAILVATTLLTVQAITGRTAP